MDKYLLWPSLAALISFLFFGQADRRQEQTTGSNHQPRCPTISVDCPTGIWHEGDPVEFQVFVTDVADGAELKYKWEVSKGRIVEGQGTTSIKVDLEGEKNDNISATVEVSGAGKGCDSKASCTASVGMRQKGRAGQQQQAAPNRGLQPTAISKFVILSGARGG